MSPQPIPIYEHVVVEGTPSGLYTLAGWMHERRFVRATHPSPLRTQAQWEAAPAPPPPADAPPPPLPPAVPQGAHGRRAPGPAAIHAAAPTPSCARCGQTKCVCVPIMTSVLDAAVAIREADIKTQQALYARLGARL